VTKLTPHGWKQHFADQVVRAYRATIRDLTNPAAQDDATAAAGK